MRYLLQTILALLLPASTLAAPLSAVAVDDYRPLKAAEQELLTEGFEAVWLASLGKELGRDIVLNDAPAQAELRIGVTASGPAYYSSEIAALTAAETGPAGWAELAGKAFCVTVGSPHLTTVTSRFGAIARVYPSVAQALIGLKLGECEAVVDNRLLLEQIAELPEWRRFNRMLSGLKDAEAELRVQAEDATLQRQIERVMASNRGSKMLSEITQHWIDEVAFQAYVLADTLDCH